ncbi:hypothetical protein BN946_scf184909.g93 [Trametes cinnabarina]|uniref:Fungal-type protein kinase domain-containing protein n=1 Tax=Pycnoporus cinnabarinus TaxID=5643 RepID=A0A060SGY7_PYCCI|nr:hypothetical protein BN946_scf184909.g93 [Trametes cinnabarina]
MNHPKFHSTPIRSGSFSSRNREITSSQCSLAVEYRRGNNQYRAAAVEDMAHKAVRLEVDEFLQHFLKAPGPSSSDLPPTLDFNPFEGIAKATEMQESEISKEFVEAVNKHNLAPGLKMSLSEQRPDVNDADQQKIDAAFFRPESVPTDGRPHWEDQMVPVEFKGHDTAKDPYDDRDVGTVDADAQTRKQVRGQVIDYARKVFEYQHRTSLIFFIVIGRRFRLSRWDRSGTIVTRAVDYVEQPHVLCEILWYMGRLSNEALGLDPTARRITRGSDDYKQMYLASLAVTSDVEHKEATLTSPIPGDAVFTYVRDMFRASLVPTFPYYRLEVPDEGRMHSFLVGKPNFQAPGMAGRGTRGYVALDAETGRFVWLKDAWRTHYEFVDAEGSVLKQLNDAKVVNVPTLICHGDILEQITETPTWWERKHLSQSAETGSGTTPSPVQPAASSSRTLVDPKTAFSKGTKRGASEMEDDGGRREECPLRWHRHYRIVVKEVGIRLVDFQHGRQLLQVIFDCVHAHQQAVVQANIMHRDVSGGNILILPRDMIHPKSGKLVMKWRGILVDWELSKPTGKAALSRPRQPERTASVLSFIISDYIILISYPQGTWQFMSAAVLSDHSKAIEISDELESFFHVTLYYAVRYLHSNCADVGAFVEGYFDAYTVENDVYHCGEKKSATTMDGTLKADSSGAPLHFGSRLDVFFQQALQWFKAHYAVKAYEDHQSAQPQTSTKELTLADVAMDDMDAILVDEVFGPEELEFDDNDPDPFAFSKPSIRAPSAQEISDAKMVTTHTAMLKLLLRTMATSKWPRDRSASDNIPANYKPQIPIAPPPGANHETVKRRKMEAHTYGPELARAALDFLSAPARPPRPGSLR